MAPGSSRDSDDRFAALSSDPRYRLPSSKHGRVAVDKRFSRMFKDEDGEFNKRAKVDKYGRRVQSSSPVHSRHLQRLYQEAESGEDEEAQRENEDQRTPEPKKGAKAKRKIELAPASDDSDEVNPDDEVREELRRVQGTYDPAREGGFASSSEESSDDEEATEDAELGEEEEAQSIPMGDASSRLALVNMDWDNIRAMDILAVANSFVPADGHIDSVAIYPSEFGKERLEREELEGPPKEIFVSGKKGAKSRGKAEDDVDLDADDDDENDDDEAIRKKLQAGDAGEEFDTTALRRYQLDRLKYFYAVIRCSSVEVAKSIYSALDTREYLSTANFFDLRFVPDEVSFDEDRPREEVTSLDAGYKPNEFVTEALTHSKVKLTWDADDATRKEVQKRAFSRNDIDENDMRAYIGGDSSSGEDEDAAAGAVEGRPSKKEAERQRMRTLLGLANEKKAKRDKDDKPVGDMQITFTAGLSGREGRDGIFENSPPRDETTMERYVRKEKERKTKRRERMKAKRGEGTMATADDTTKHAEDSGSDIGGDVVAAAASTSAADSDDADPFNDPFFNDPEVASKSKKEKQRKEERVKRRDAKRAQEEKEAAERSQLELLMDDGGEKMRHFDMKEIQKAAKRKSKRDKKRTGKDDEGDAAATAVDDGIETSDPRFAKLFESHEYAIDPTNPRFQKTEGMLKILEEGRKRRRKGGEGEERDRKREKRLHATKDQADAGHDDDTQKLMARVKARSRNQRNGK